MTLSVVIDHILLKYNLVEMLRMGCNLGARVKSLIQLLTARKSYKGF